LLCAEVFGTDVVLNILLFVPLGLGLRLATGSRRWVLALSAAITLAVELTQWFFVSGRIASVSDLVANLLGASVGMLLAERGHRIIYPEATMARLFAGFSIVGWLVVQALTIWAFTPSLIGGAFFGQLAADLGHMDRFTGRVISAGIGATPVTSDRMKDNEALQRLFHSGSHVHAVIVTGQPPPALAPIVSVFNGDQHEIMVLGQHGQDLVFRIRTHSTNARLRTPTVSLWNAFPPPGTVENGSPSDTLSISGWRSRWRMHVSVAGRDTSFTRSIALRPSFGWALMLPFEHTGTPLAWRYTAVWLAVLLFPAGYWGALGLIPEGHDAGGRLALKAMFRVLTFLGFAAVVLSAGLIALPVWLDLPSAGVWEWGGVLAGIAGGMLAGSLSCWIGHSRLPRSPE